MDRLVISGGQKLSGAVPVSGSKNAALPILIAALLTDEPCVVENVPCRLRDIKTALRLLESLGKRVQSFGSRVKILPDGSLKTQAPYELVKQMRASVLAAGPLLARFGLVRVPIPGGCAIGLRPIDMHLKGFAAMGARQVSDRGDIILSAPGFLNGAKIRLDYASVGATENVMLAAAATDGTTIIENAAREPEIRDLGRCLALMGARVSGMGSSKIAIRGRARLAGFRHAVIPDRIEAGTFLTACASAQGHIFLDGADAGDLSVVLEALEKTGAAIRTESQGIRISMRSRPRPMSIETKPYPGFPTDLQAPWMSLMCLALGKSRIRETIFENRFLHAAELSRMGARIGVKGGTATIDGIENLSGAWVMASDIRGGAALLVAALAARGRTIIQRVYHIDRGYEDVEAKLRGLGARVKRAAE
ncbi:MAG: UDP-N-acetylglucosamine 1-carboxyvinyltransferase [Elusimicrobiota bacterium]